MFYWNMKHPYLKTFLKEPLLHFFVLGGVIFLLNAVFGNPDYIPENNKIIVTNKGIESRVNQFAMQMGRPASKAEIKGFIDKYIHEEVLSREAKILGLDNDDIVIRRRLVQKMEFMSGGISEVPEPDSIQLIVFFEENKEEYMQDATFSFYQIYINSQDLSESALNQKVIEIKSKLSGFDNMPEMAYTLGDRTMLANEFTRSSTTKIFQSFGDEGFVKAIEDGPKEEWIGPQKSTYGHHLIFITGKTDSYAQDFSQIAFRVKQDYIDYIKKEAQESFFAQMQDRYIVDMDEELKALYYE